ncbi:hypothetical protein FQA39_LY07087 [Lamprigera yunnana]|nr:hypothetical protein FQA39_LY07087 [Lamprigera yunnana]
MAKAEIKWIFLFWYLEEGSSSDLEKICELEEIYRVKKQGSSSSESYDSDDICQGSDISDFICDEGDELFEDSETKFTLDLKEICLNDFVSVSLKEIKKKVLKEFVGQIIGVVAEVSNNSEVAYKVKFMRNYRQHADIFVFPEVDDVSIIYESTKEIPRVSQSSFKQFYFAPFVISFYPTRWGKMEQSNVIKLC